MLNRQVKMGDGSWLIVRGMMIKIHRYGLILKEKSVGALLVAIYQWMLSIYLGDYMGWITRKQ